MRQQKGTAFPIPGRCVDGPHARIDSNWGLRWRISHQPSPQMVWSLPKAPAPQACGDSSVVKSEGLPRPWTSGEQVRGPQTETVGYQSCLGSLTGVDPPLVALHHGKFVRHKKQKTIDRKTNPTGRKVGQWAVQPQSWGLVWEGGLNPQPLITLRVPRIPFQLWGVDAAIWMP